jgi:hypothetical protein
MSMSRHPMTANEQELHELLREAEVLIDSMATWFRNQPLGCPPAGTAEWQARVGRVLAAGVTQAPAPSWQAEAVARHAYERGANAMRDRAILVIEARHESGYDCSPWLLVKAIRDAEVPRDPCGVEGRKP